MAEEIIDISELADRFKSKTKDYGKIFGLRLANGFAAKRDFRTIGTAESITLTREFVKNVTQPGQTGKINNVPTNVLAYKQRKATLRPFKADILLDEVELAKLRVSWLADKQPADPRDINSIAGRDYIMGKIFKQIMHEVNKSIFMGQLGYGLDDTDQSTIDATAFQGGLNLMDGLGIQFTAGYATTGPGFVGDIPGDNKATSPAATITEANVLTELAKFEEMIGDIDTFEEFVYDDDPETPAFNIFMDGKIMIALDGALDNLTYKTTKLVEKGENGLYRFKKFPKVALKKRRWMAGTDNMWGAPSDNIFFIHPEVGVDIPMIKFQEIGRGVQILIDGKLAVDYADGRFNLLYK